VTFCEHDRGVDDQRAVGVRLRLRIELCEQRHPLAGVAVDDDDRSVAGQRRLQVGP
jgi:hypothetical protein